MPELPEVDYCRRQLEVWLKGQELLEVSAVAGTPLRQTSPASLRKLVGTALKRVERRGKHLLLEFSGRGAPLGLYLHLGMSGKLVERPRGSPAPRFRKVTFTTARRDVHLCDARRFGRVRLLPWDRLRELPELEALGPDAWTAPPTAAQLGLRLGRGKRAIKVALLDQTVVAGLGNIQASEALWRARLSPFLATGALSAVQLAALRRAIHATLAFTLQKLGGVERGSDIHYVEEGGENWFKVYDRAGLPCRRDKTPIERTVQAARSTFYCPTCQAGPPVGARPRRSAKLASRRAAR